MLVYTIPWANYKIDVPFSGRDYRLWLDLQGWIELDYKIDLDSARKDPWYDSTIEKEIVEWLKTIIDKRVEILNINDSEINDASYWNEKHIIVQIPLKWNDTLENSKNIETAKEAIWKVVKIAFKERRTEVTEADLKERENIAKEAEKEIKSWEPFQVVASKYRLNFENIKIWKAENLDNIKKENGELKEKQIN